MIETPTSPDDLSDVKEAMSEAYSNIPARSKYYDQRTNENFQPSWGDRIADIPKGIARGGMGATGSLVKLVDDAQGSLTGKHLATPDEYKSFGDSLASQTVLGGLTKGIVQYSLTKSWTAGLMPSGGGLAGTVGRAGAVNAMAFDGDDGRFADMLAGASPTFRNSAIGWLASNPDDGWATKRLKNAVEGSALDFITHAGTKLLGKAYTAALGRLKGVETPEAAELFSLSKADPEAFKALQENPEAQRILGQVQEANKVNNTQISDEQVYDILHTFGNAARRGGVDDLTTALKGIDIRASSPEALQASLDTAFQGKGDYSRVIPTEGINAEGESANAGSIPVEPAPVRPANDGTVPLASPPSEGGIPVADSGESSTGVKPVPLAEPVQPKLDVPDNARGAVQFVNDHQAVIHLFQNADFSTLLHESAHVWDKWWVTGADRAVLDSAFGGDKEALVSAFERYARDGIAPDNASPAVLGVLARFKGWMTEIYKSITGGSLGNEVRPDVRKVFDGILSGEPSGDFVEPGVQTPGNSVHFQRGLVKTPTLADTAPAASQNDLKAVAKSMMESGAPTDAQLQRTVETAAISFNGARTGAKSTALDLMHSVNLAYADAEAEAGGGVQNLKQFQRDTSYTASVIATDGDALARKIASMKGLPEVQAQINRTVAIGRHMFTSLSNSISDLAAKHLAASAIDQPGIAEQISWQFEQMAQIQNMTDSIRLEQGRGLGQYRFIPTQNLKVSKAADSFLKQMKSKPNSPAIKQMLGAIASAGDDEVAQAVNMKQMMTRLSNSTLNAVIEYRGNALISGLATPQAKALFDITQTIMRPVERAIGGKLMQGIASLVPENSTIGQWARGGAEAAQTAAFELTYTHRLASSAFSMIGRVEGVHSPFEAGFNAFKTEQTALAGVRPPMHAISSESLHMDPSSALGRMVDFVGPIIRLPQRVMEGITETAQNMKYQSLVQAKAAVEGTRMGLNPSELKAHVDGKLVAAFDGLGQATDKAALLEAQQVSATAPLQGFSRKIGNAINAHPWTKLIVPFYKTPLNLIDQAVQYTPGLNLLSRNFRQMLFGGDVNQKAVAMGKLAVGATFWSAVMPYAMSGNITGDGPTDPKLRETWITAGNRPHSLMFENEDGSKTYVDYHKLEPFSNMLSVAGDYADMSHLMKEEDMGTAAKFMTMAIAKNAVSSSYLKGLSNFVNMLSKPEHSMEKFLGNFSGSFVPRVIGNLDPDEDFREVRGFMDGIKARVPGYSSTLMPVRNALGEPVTNMSPGYSPVRFANEPNDSVSQEFSQYNKGLPGNPRSLNGVDLSKFINEKGQDARDRMAELQSQVKIGGKTIRDSLNGLFQSQAYQSQPKVTDPTDLSNPRVHAVQSIFQGYQGAAKSQMLKEYPQIQQFFLARQQAQQKASNSNIQRISQF